MTVIFDSKREQALVEATVKLVQHLYQNRDKIPLQSELITSVMGALRAYEPPKPKVAIIPTWDELTEDQKDQFRHAIAADTTYITCWDAIRALTAQET
jgi:hypothetical protein